MTKGTELLQTLSPEIQEKFRNNCSSNKRFAQIEQADYIDIEQLMSTAFVWQNTPEGHDFWGEISKGGQTTIKDTLENAKKRLSELELSDDTEGAHVEADEILCNLLILFGQKEVVDLFKNIEKWYAKII